MLRITNYKEKGGSAVLINLDGKRVYQSSEIEEFLDITDLPSSVYILQLIDKMARKKSVK